MREGLRRAEEWLPRAVDRPEVLRAARAKGLFPRWPEIVGPLLAERSWPDRWDKGTVYVAVVGSAWAQELRMHRERILARFAELSGEPSLIVQVRFGVRPPRIPPPAPVPDGYVPPPEGMSIAEMREWRKGR